MKRSDIIPLEWPEETASPAAEFESWSAPGSNICLDFHGDPGSDLAVFSDGNHHMALKECLECFLEQNSNLSGIFYATTPPAPIVSMFRNNGLKLGNLIIRVTPHVFISPPDIIKCLAREELIQAYQPLVRNQGCVLLVKKNNPRNIQTVLDLNKEGIRLFLSSPETEKSSYQSYYRTLKSLSGLDAFPDDLISSGRVMFGRRIHHREAPQAVASGNADAAVVFYHLGLRYIRIFPDVFDIIPLGGSVEKPDPLPGNEIGTTCIGIAGGGDRWGKKFMSFMKSEKAMQIYQYHGLLPWDGGQIPNSP